MPLAFNSLSYICTHQYTWRWHLMQHILLSLPHLPPGMVLHVLAHPKNAAKKRKGEEYKGKVCVLGAGVAGLQVYL